MDTKNKKGKLRVRDKVVYLERPPFDDEKASKDIKYIEADPPEPDMVDYNIVADEFRKRLKDNEGRICIGVLPGDNLGELFINIQFEGKKGAWNYCMRGQNNLLLNSSEWLKDIFGEFLGTWNVDIHAKPCPHASVSVEVDLAAKILSHELSLDGALNSMNNKNIINDIEIENDHENILNHET